MSRSDLETSTASALVDATHKQPIHVLHVDDDQGFLKAARQMLEMQDGFQVETALSVEEAMEKLELESFDVVVSDYKMPGKDGLDFLEELRDSGDRVPFIIFTGKGKEEVAIKALNLGADRYLHKHGDPEAVYGELAYSIRKAVDRKEREKKILDQRNFMRGILEAIPDPVYVIDVQDYTIKMANSAAGFGALSEESKCYTLTHQRNRPCSGAKHLCPVEEVKKTKKPVTVEHIHVDEDGNRRDVEVHAAPIFDHEGKISQIVEITIDITEQKKTEKAVRKSREKFRRLFMGNPEAAVYLDKDSRILDVNPKFEYLFGYSLDEVKGRPINQVVVPEDKMEEAEMVDKKAKKGYVNRDTVRKGRDGTLIPVSVSAAPIIIQDRFLGEVVMYRDISQLKRTERELEESKRHFQHLFNVMVDPVVIVDGEGTILEVSNSLQKLSGYERKELVGKNFLEVKALTAKSKAVATKKLAERMRGRHIPPYTVEVVPKDGKKRCVEVNAAKIMYKGEPADMVVFRDITERKKMEEKLRVVGRLSRHDVRNKLSAVTSNAYLTRKKLSPDHEALQYVEDIESAVEQAVRIFDFARTYEQLGTKQMEYRDVERSFNHAVQQFPEMQNLKVENHCQGLKVLADSLLSRLFYNLIHNSLQHAGEVSHIRVHHQEAEEELQLVYEDDGIGIPEDEKEKIFQEEYGKDSGYGLYLIRKMCEVYGWSIQENGKPGEGARFIMTIPQNTETEKRGYRLD